MINLFSEEWHNILDEVNEHSKNGSWYRGHSSEKFKLLSGLYRKGLKSPSDYTSTEKTYYNLFIRDGFLLHGEKDWNLLFIMQHHGVQTRLLDWSESFATALFFAYSKWDFKENCVVWILNPLQLNKKTLGEAKYYLFDEKYEELINEDGPSFNDNTLALYPVRNSTRIVSQLGMFTLQGKVGKPLEEEESLVKEGILKKIVLQPNLKEDIENFLKITGVNDYTVFSDLDGLAKQINKMNYSARSAVTVG